MLLIDLWSEVNAQFRILTAKEERAESEDVLHNAALLLRNIFNHPQIDALVIVDGDECFFDAMNLFVCDDDQVEEVCVEARKGDEVCEDEEECADDEQ